MKTDAEIERLLRQNRPTTTAEHDQRILADALAAMHQSAVERQSKPVSTAIDNVAAPTGQPAVFLLRTLARILRRHWRLSTAVACVLVLLVVLPLALRRTPVEDSGRVRDVAALTESPENPAPPTRGTEGGNTSHEVAALTDSPENPAPPTLGTKGGLNTAHGARGWVGPPKTDAAGTRKLVLKLRTTSNARGFAIQPKNIDAPVVPDDKSRHFGTQPPAAATRPSASRSAILAGQGKQAARPCYAGGGRVVDAETGEPVVHFAYQEGWPDSRYPSGILWAGTSYREKGWRGGRFNISHSCVKRGKVRVRILADGYLPEVAVAEANKDGLLEAPLVVRLRRGKEVPGRVLDHQGKPVVGAKVVLGGGGPWRFLDGRIKHLGGKRTTTDADGCFVATGGGNHVKHILVFAPHLNIWSVPAPGNLGEPEDSGSEGLIIKLPQPATLRVVFDIPGAVDKREIHDQEPGGLLVPAGGNAQLKLKLLKMDGEGWKGAGDTRQWATVANPGEVLIDNLAPGVYDFYRQINLGFRGGRGIRTRFYGRREITLKPGETQVVRFVRDKGQRVTGEIQGLPEGSSDVLVTVSPLSHPGKTGKREPADWVSCKRNGQFLTPLLAPGEYRIAAAAYAPPKPRGDASSKPISISTAIRPIPTPGYVGAVNVTVKKSGPPVEVRIEMKHRSASRKATPTAGGRATSAAKPAKAAAEPTVEATGAKPDDRATAVRPASDPTFDGKEILDKLKSIDAVYAAAFTASGTYVYGPDWPRKKWKFTMHRGRIALEEEVVEIPKPKETTKRFRSGPIQIGPRQKGQFIAMRSTFYVGPAAQAKYDWVGRIPRYGPLDRWPENSPGPATGGNLRVDDPGAPTYMLQIRQPLLCLGRGYSKYITKIRDVSPQKDGRLKVVADGLGMVHDPGAKWELVIDPDAEYMVRSAQVVYSGKRRSFTNSGLTRHGSHCVPEKGEHKGAFVSPSFEFQSASFEADVEFLKHAKATMQPPYLIHTDVHDRRRTPVLYIPYDAGKMSPKGGKPGLDLD